MRVRAPHQGRQDRDRRVHAAPGRVGHRRARDRRPAVRARALRRKEPAEREVVDVVARAVAVWPELAVAGRRAVDQTRVVDVHCFEPDAELVRNAGPERVDDHVGVRREPKEGVPPALGLQVEARALRAAPRAIREPRRRPPITADRSDLDHLRAEIAQDLRAAARRTDRRVVQDGDAGKLLVHQFSTGRPRPRRARMFFCTSDVPAPTVSTTL